MVQVKIEAIRVNLIGSHRVVILKDVDSERYLPVWIGPAEADAITVQLTDTTPARPLTHDLIASLLNNLGATVRYVVISDLQNETFYARIVLETRPGNEMNVDSRPSDAINIAVRVKCPIYVEDEIMLANAQMPEEEGTAAAVADEDLGAFQDFLGSLDLDDMEKKS